MSKWAETGAWARGVWKSSSVTKKSKTFEGIPEPCEGQLPQRGSDNLGKMLGQASQAIGSSGSCGYL